MNPHRHYPRDTDAEGQFDPHGPWFARVAATIRAVPPHSRVLDIGCNTGGMGRCLAGPVDLTGIDLSPLVLPRARSKGYRVVQGDAEALPFTAGQFDVVICSEILEHTDHPTVVVQEVARVLRPGGLFLGDVPTWYGKWGYRSLRGHKWHQHAFTRASLSALLTHVGTVQYITAHPPWGRSSPFWVPQWYGWEVRR